MEHMESEHSGDMRMKFLREPDQPVRRLHNGSTWRTYHETLHRLDPAKYDHSHSEDKVEQQEPRFTEKSERIWLNPETGNAFMSPEAAKMHGDCDPQSVILYRPTLAPIYGGETLSEALWSEMDRLMEGLMTQTDSEDGGDKFRAVELAWVLAVVSNPYAPSVDAIRAEAMERWKAAEAEADQAERNATDVYNTQLSGGTGDEFA